MAKLKRFESATKTVEKLFAFYETKKKDYRSRGLGISTLGEKCERRLWYDFRWASPLEKLSGKKKRLFDTGDREEARMIEELRACGVTVLDRDTNGKQFRVELFGGHVSGYLDGLLEDVPDAPGEQLLLEAKTHNAKNFAELAESTSGVKSSHVKHFIQCQMGMGMKGLRKTLYLGKNKDDDDQHGEILGFDEKVFEENKRKSERIVFAQDPPERASDNPEVPPCLLTSRKGELFPCPHLGVCHRRQIPEVNCRTCLHSTPERDGTWSCARHNRVVSKDEQEKGCGNHLFIPSLLAFGKPIDAGENFVAYAGLTINREGGRIDKP